MSRVGLIANIAFLAISVGCSPSTLTLSKAKTLLEAKAPVVVYIYPTADELAAGVEKGLWVRTGLYKATPLLNNCMVFTDSYRGTLSPRSGMAAPNGGSSA